MIPRGGLAVGVVGAVAEIEAKDVRAGLEQRLDHLGICSSRPERRHDLGSTIAPHRQ